MAFIKTQKIVRDDSGKITEVRITLSHHRDERLKERQFRVVLPQHGEKAGVAFQCAFRDIGEYI